MDYIISAKAITNSRGNEKKYVMYIKLFQWNKKWMETLIKTVGIINNNIEIELGIEKYTTLRMNEEKIIKINRSAL